MTTGDLGRLDLSGHHRSHPGDRRRIDRMGRPGLSPNPGPDRLGRHRYRRSPEISDHGRVDPRGVGPHHRERVGDLIGMTNQQGDRITVEDVDHQWEEFVANPHPGEPTVVVVLVVDHSDTGSCTQGPGLVSTQGEKRPVDQIHRGGDPGRAGAAEQVHQDRLGPIVGGVGDADIGGEGLVTGPAGPSL